jgi:uncharacterized membrane protein
MLAAVLAALSSGMWGVADFLGGVASRRVGSTAVLLISYPAGATFLTVVALWVIPGAITGEAVLLGLVAGCVGLAAIVLLYRALVQGPMSIVSPITAVVAGAITVGFGLLRGERLGTVAVIGIVGAALAVVLVSYERGATIAISRITLLTSIGSGICIGAFLVVIGSVPEGTGIWAVVISRWWSALLILGFVLATSKVRLPARYPWVLVIAVGSLDALANAVFQLAAQQGMLSIVAVIGSLYPAATVVLAWVFLRERLALVQLVGVLLALVSAGLLATAA